MTATVATDGSCLGNPGPTGWAWVHQDGTWQSGSLRHGTNNIGELMAIQQALRAHMGVKGLRIESDSSYAINCVTKWFKGWERNGWRKSDGSAILNVEIIKDIVRLIREHPGVEFFWVKGHSSNILNSWADNRALNASQSQEGDQSGKIPATKIRRQAPGYGANP